MQSWSDKRESRGTAVCETLRCCGQPHCRAGRDPGHLAQSSSATNADPPESWRKKGPGGSLPSGPPCAGTKIHIKSRQKKALVTASLTLLPLPGQNYQNGSSKCEEKQNHCNAWDEDTHDDVRPATGKSFCSLTLLSSKASSKHCRAGTWHGWQLLLLTSLSLLSLVMSVGKGLAWRAREAGRWSSACKEQQQMGHHSESCSTSSVLRTPYCHCHCRSIVQLWFGCTVW